MTPPDVGGTVTQLCNIAQHIVEIFEDEKRFALYTPDVRLGFAADLRERIEATRAVLASPRDGASEPVAWVIRDGIVDDRPEVRHWWSHTDDWPLYDTREEAEQECAMLNTTVEPHYLRYYGIEQQRPLRVIPIYATPPAGEPPRTKQEFERLWLGDPFAPDPNAAPGSGATEEGR